MNDVPDILSVIGNPNRNDQFSYILPALRPLDIIFHARIDSQKKQKYAAIDAIAAAIKIS
jgi:hypothetical protein